MVKQLIHTTLGQLFKISDPRTTPSGSKENTGKTEREKMILIMDTSSACNAQVRERTLLGPKSACLGAVLFNSVG